MTMATVKLAAYSPYIRCIRRQSFKTNEQIHEMGKELRRFGGGDIILEENKEAAIATITLDNPNTKNAITGSMMYDLFECVTFLSQWEEGKAFIIKGSAANFCSGADINFMRAIANTIYGRTLSMFMQEVSQQLYSLPLVGVALIEGAAIGGGAELAMSCDFRVMKDDAKIGFVHRNMGLTPGWGGCARLVDLVGRRIALDLLASARMLSAEEALARGLADHVIPSTSDGLAETTDWLQIYTSADCKSVQAAKRAVAATTDAEIRKRMIPEFDVHKAFGASAHQQALYRLKK